MAYPVNDLVLEIGEIGITGNIIPAHWYQALTFDNGKPNFVAVTLLSEIVYWYRPKIQKDESTGLVKPPQKKFKADFLQRNTKQFAAQFGFSDKQARDGLRFLEDKGIIKRHLRTLTLESGLVLSNVLFVELISSGLKKLQKIHTYGHAGQDLLPPTSNPIDMQGGTYTETTSKTSTEKDNVSTLPSFKKTNEKRKKDIVSTLPSSKKKVKPKAFPSPNRFVKSLSPDQRKIHNQLVAFKPEWGKPLESDAVSAWFNMSPAFTIKQVKDAFTIYKQDVVEAKGRGGRVDSMGATMRGAMNKGRTPRNDDAEFNRAHAERVAAKYPWMQVLQRYVKVEAGVVKGEVELNQTKQQFITQLDSLTQKAILYA